ncbi:MAG: hypothetical protein RDV48_25320 [Candidatus Eremiobacteraeota bacterium]|nr:hypothetical protein [Candidatus Eremiobacteraeota bacterium]
MKKGKTALLIFALFLLGGIILGALIIRESFRGEPAGTPKGTPVPSAQKGMLYFSLSINGAFTQRLGPGTPLYATLVFTNTLSGKALDLSGLGGLSPLVKDGSGTPAGISWELISRGAPATLPPGSSCALSWGARSGLAKGEYRVEMEIPETLLVKEGSESLRILVKPAALEITGEKNDGEREFYGRRIRFIKGEYEALAAELRDRVSKNQGDPSLALECADALEMSGKTEEAREALLAFAAHMEKEHGAVPSWVPLRLAALRKRTK